MTVLLNFLLVLVSLG